MSLRKAVSGVRCARARMLAAPLGAALLLLAACSGDIRNPGIGARHLIQVGAQTINVLGLASDASIIPDPTAAKVTAVGQYTASTSTLSATSVTLFLNN